jgi:hypothetical protein
VAGSSTRRPRVVGNGGARLLEDCHGGGGPLLLELGGALACAPFGGARRRTLLLGAGLRPAELGGAPCFRPARLRGGIAPRFRATRWRGRRRGGQHPVQRRQRPRLRLRPAEVVGALGCLLGRSPSLILARQLIVVVVRASRSWEGRGERLFFLLANNVERGVKGNPTSLK